MSADVSWRSESNCECEVMLIVVTTSDISMNIGFELPLPLNDGVKLLIDSGLDGTLDGGRGSKGLTGFSHDKRVALGLQIPRICGF